jgi:hypothetical protein
LAENKLRRCVQMATVAFGAGSLAVPPYPHGRWSSPAITPIVRRLLTPSAPKLVGRRGIATTLGTRDYAGFVGSADVAQEAVEAIASAGGWVGTALGEAS